MGKGSWDKKGLGSRSVVQTLLGKAARYTPCVVHMWPEHISKCNITSYDNQPEQECMQHCRQLCQTRSAAASLP